MDVPYYYSDITYGNIPIEVVKGIYAKWNLGMDSTKAHQRHLEEGLPEHTDISSASGASNWGMTVTWRESTRTTLPGFWLGSGSAPAHRLQTPALNS